MLLGEEIENDFHRDERAGKKERKQNGWEGEKYVKLYLTKAEFR